MRRWLLALVVTGVGCDGVFGLTSREPIDADVPIDAPVDADGDGLLDGVDNCPMIANADQLDGDHDGRGDVCDACPQLTEVNDHDEDGDGIGDRCDNCPHIAGGTQANSDGDDLGDRCDSAPLLVDCIVRFDPFVTLPTAERTTGTWKVENDELRQTDPEFVHAIFVFESPLIATPYVETSARTIAVTTDPAMQIQAGVWGAIHAGGSAIGLPAGLISEVLSSPAVGGTRLYMSQVEPSGAATTLEMGMLAPAISLQVGSRTTLGLRIPTANSYEAGAQVGDSQLNFSGSLPQAVPIGRVGLRTVLMATGFAYLLVVDRPAVSACPPR